MDIAEWLRGLGLDQYESAFRANGVEADLLADLTADDLKELGVVAVGDRRRMLKAIEALRGGGETPPLPPPAPSAPASPSSPSFQPAAPAPRSEGERRPLTVMFCDLVGSTALSASMDPEDWRELNAAYHRAVAATIEQYGGYVAQKLGDGAMIYFGYPAARENDTERAVRAGLAIHQSLAALSTELVAAGKPEITARVGMHTGSVVVDGGAYVFGDVPNLAARVQSAAAPGEVLITAALHRQVAGLVVIEDRGSHTLKGFSEPVALLRVARISGVRARRAAGSAAVSLVGRDEELAILNRRWERTLAGTGQLVMVAGEPGLGKSRLVEEFRATLADVPHSWIDWSCAQLLQTSPFHPMIDWERQRYGGPEVDPAQRLRELEATFQALDLDAAETITLLAPLLELPLPSDYPRQTGSPAALRPKLLAALVGWILAAARAQPLVLVIEDLHWADPSTLDLLRLLADQGAAARLMLLVTGRPEFRPDWPSRSHHTHINLAPLLQADASRIVAEIVAKRGLTPDEVAAVVERSGGVPLFLEEVTRLLIEGDPSGTRAIPDTLAASLAARLDRLGSVRDVAQIGAVLGREFTWPLLRAVIGMDDEGLRLALDRLAEAGLLQAEGVPPDARYRFKHALLQEAAYEGLLKSRRQKLHLQAAEALEAQAGGAAPAPELLAHHFARAGAMARAAAAWEKAGDQAVARSSYAEAVAAYTAAADGLKGATDAAHHRLLLDTLLKLGPVTVVTNGIGSGKSGPAYEQAYRLSRELADERAQFKAAWGLWLIDAGQADFRSATARADELVSISRHIGDEELLYEARHCGWATAHFRGHVRVAREMSHEGLRDYRRERHAGRADQYAGHDPGVCAGTVYAINLCASGAIDQGLRAADAAVALGQSIDHPNSLAHGLAMSLIAAYVAGDRMAVRRFADRLLALASRFHFPAQRLAAEFYKGWAAGLDGDLDGGLAMMGQAFESRQLQPHFGRTAFVAAWAEMLLAAGRTDEADAAIAEALAASRVEEGSLVPELWRVKGEILLAREGVGERAEQAFMTALDIASRQEALHLELRAATALARGLARSGRQDQARARLAPLYGRFSEGLGTPHLRAAKAVLDGSV